MCVCVGGGGGGLLIFFLKKKKKKNNSTVGQEVRQSRGVSDVIVEELKTA